MSGRSDSSSIGARQICMPRSEVLRLLRVRDRATLAQLVRLGAVPRPVPPGDGRWLASDIERCMADLPAAPVEEG